MVDRLAELGALQYAAANTATASVNPSRIAASGYIHAMYAEYVTWSLANPGVNPSRLSAKGRIFGYFYDNATFSPLSLFAASEVGAWYDPSDLSTMFQDSTGTTPVTADGQPVGLILDKSKAIALTEKITTLFSAYSSSVVNQVTSGFELINPAGGYGAAQTPVAVTSGRLYKITFDYLRGASAPAGVRTIIGFGSGSPSQYDVTNTSGSKTVYIAATITGNVQFAVQFIDGNSGRSGTFTNFTCKEVSGNHAVAPSDAARPLKTSTGAAKWINYDAVDDVLNTTFTASLGSSCTVCRANVGGAPTILTGQTIGTSYADSTDHAGLIIINRALTGQETTDVTAWLTAKGAT